MSTTVLHPRATTRRGPSGSTVASVFAALALAAVIGYGIAQDSGASSSDSATRGQVASVSVAGVERAHAAFLEQIRADFPRTDSIWSNKADVVNGQAIAQLLPRTDPIWSGQADLVNGLSPAGSTQPATYGPMRLSQADLIAFEMGYSLFPRTDSIWSGQADVVNGSAVSTASQENASVVIGGWDVINGTPAESGEQESQALGGGGVARPHYFE